MCTIKDMHGRFVEYIRPTGNKIALWIALMLLLLSVWGMETYKYSLQPTVYQASRKFTSGKQYYGSYQTSPSADVPWPVLVATYATISYILSCIFIESFGTIRRSNRKTAGKKRKK